MPSSSLEVYIYIYIYEPVEEDLEVLNLNSYVEVSKLRVLRDGGGSFVLEDEGGPRCRRERQA